MRCKSCDVPLEESEVVWNEELGEHEELCNVCLYEAGIHEIRGEEADKEAAAARDEILDAFKRGV